MSAFELDARLRNDTHRVGELALCSVLLMDDARFPWLILVPRIAGMRELLDLDDASRTDLYAEIDRVSRAIRELYTPDKQNIAALGNVVEQLHVHVIARYRSDAAWPRPVWGHGDRIAYAEPAAIERLIALRTSLGIGAS